MKPYSTMSLSNSFIISPTFHSFITSKNNIYSSLIDFNVNMWESSINMASSSPEIFVNYSLYASTHFSKSKTKRGAFVCLVVRADVYIQPQKKKDKGIVHIKN